MTNQTDPTKVERLTVHECDHCGERWVPADDLPPRHYVCPDGSVVRHIEVIPAQEVERLEQERDSLQHIIDCANTPLMRDVLRERDDLKQALRELVETGARAADTGTQQDVDAFYAVLSQAREILGDK